jgi:hypothetical protein
MPINLPDNWGVKKPWKQQKMILENGVKVKVVGMKSLSIYGNDLSSIQAVKSTKGMIGIAHQASITSSVFPNAVLWHVDFPQLKDFWIYLPEDLEVV